MGLSESAGGLTQRAWPRREGGVGTALTADNLQGIHSAPTGALAGPPARMQWRQGAVARRGSRWPRAFLESEFDEVCWPPYTS